MASTENPLELKFFKDNGFVRKQCSNCGLFFWTLDEDRKTCGDPPCDRYTFINNPPVDKRYTLDEMREAFIGFFRDDHKFIPPYPVVPRWRDDVLLVNASIYDFQPHVTSGVVPPPGNPLVMSQPSIRMVDIDNVGTTGRHLTTFEMMCHDSFNNRKQVYWKEETVAYCHAFLKENLGISPELVVYKEKPWSGGGNGGNALEVMVEGLEVATLVFMDMREDPDGDTEIDGLLYSPMEMKVVDTGYGLERLTWLSQGTPTVYEAIYPTVVDYVIRNSDANLMDRRIMEIAVQNFARYEGKTENEVIRLTLPEVVKVSEGITEEEFIREFHTLKSAFIIADHARTLLLLFSDYVIPSNIKAGYLVRMLIRRALRNIELINFKGTIRELIEMHWESLRNIIKNYPADFAELMLQEETKKYRETLVKGRGAVERILKKKKTVRVEDLLTLYDSSGLHPDFVASVVKEETGLDIDIPDDFHREVIALHEETGKKRKEASRFPDIKTRPLYYDDVNISEFNAIVMESGKGYVILNQTAFYPEGGGQPTDLGHFVYRGKKVEVKKVERYGDTIVHWIEGEMEKGSRILGYIDTFRRRRLMAHHSATHLILGVMKEILGPHVWQFGVQKGVETSRIDITHYRKITEDEIRKIESRCLHYIREGRPIRVKNIDWNKAIDSYGFTIFQGGVPLAPKLRIVEIEGVDVEGCGGTHMSSTSELGIVKIVSADSIQEGIQRITFVAGDAALAYVQDLYSSARSLQSLLAVDISEIPERAGSIIRENIELKKERDNMLKKAVNSVIDRASMLDLPWGKAAIIRAGLDEEGMKLLSKVLFSKGLEVSVVVNERSDGKFSYVVTSRGRVDGRKIIEELLGDSVETGGTASYATAVSPENADEKLIKEVLDKL